MRSGWASWKEKDGYWTWSLMGVEIPAPLISDKTLEYNFTNEGGVGGTIRFLKNIMGLWLVQECRRCWERAGRSHTYDELTRLAEAGPAGAWAVTTVALIVGPPVRWRPAAGRRRCPLP